MTQVSQESIRRLGSEMAENEQNLRASQMAELAAQSTPEDAARTAKEHAEFWLKEGRPMTNKTEQLLEALIDALGYDAEEKIVFTPKKKDHQRQADEEVLELYAARPECTSIVLEQGRGRYIRHEGKIYREIG